MYFYHRYLQYFLQWSFIMKMSSLSMQHSLLAAALGGLMLRRRRSAVRN